MNMIKKTAITACAIATISMAALSAGATDANAGWKKHKKFHHHFRHHYAYDYGYRHCKPKFRKIWVYSPYHGRKIKRWVKVGKWCGHSYYGY